MGKLEDFKPILKPGQKFIRGSHILFVPNDGSEAVVLSIDQGMVLSYLDGQRSLIEIIRELWMRDGSVNFRALFVTLRKLKSAEALANSEQFPDNQNFQSSVYEKSPHFLFRPIFKRQILAPREVGSRPWLFAILALGVIVVAILGLSTKYVSFASNEFLRVEGSYLTGLLAFFVASSLLQSFKNWIKYLLISHRLGSTPPVSVELGLFGLCLKTDDEALFLTLKASEATLFWLATNLAMFAFSYIWAYGFGSAHLHNVLLPLSLVISLVDLDPYTKSEATKFFRRFFSSYNLSDLIPYFRKRALLAILDRRTQMKDQIFMTIYSTFGAAWTFGAYYITAVLFSRTFPNLISEMQISEGGSERLAAGAILLGLGAVNLLFLVDSLQLVIGNLLWPFSTGLLKLLRTMNSRVDSNVPTKLVREIIEGQPLFADMAPSAVDYLAAHSKVKVFRKGTPILIQGTPGDEMYVLLSGKVEVRHRRPSGAVVPIVSMNAPTVFGEMAVLGQGVRTAHVTATEICQCLVLDRKTLEGLKEAFDASEYFKVVGRIQLQQFMAASPMFQDMPREIIQRFASIGTYVDVRAGQVIVKQGELGDSFYLLVRGSVDVSVKGIRVRAIEQGGFFGEISLLTHVRRTATVTAATDCKVYQIRAEEFWKLLTENLGFAMYIESIAEIRLKEDVELERLSA